MTCDSQCWCSMKEITKYLGVHRQTVFTWIKKENMPATKIGHLWKFKINEIDDWIKSREYQFNINQKKGPEK